MNKITFGEILRALRESRNLSQKELAYKTNIDPSHLNKIEKGSRMPSDDVLFRLADVLVTVELFLAAGRVVPPEFEKKHPPEKNPRLRNFEELKESLPDTLKKLYAIYQNQFETYSSKTSTKEDNLRAAERIISTNTNLYYSLKEQINDPKCKELINVADDILNTYYFLVGQMWKFSISNWEDGVSAGKSTTIFEIWDEINKIIEKDSVLFFVEFFNMEKNDAELIAEIIRVIKKRKKLPNP